MIETDNISSEVFASVWEALGNSPADAAEMRLRSELMIAIKHAVDGWSLTQFEAARHPDVTQPRLGDLLCGRIGNFTLKAVVLLAERTGLGMRIQIEQAAK